MLSALAPARRRMLLGLAVALFVVALAVAALVIQGRGSRASVTSHAQDRPGPVLLIPGYGGSVASLGPLATALRASGKDVTVVMLPGGAVGDLRVQAAALADAARGALTRTGARSVDVVGYSAGGVVARIWLQDDGGAQLVRRVVTLGSPHHGTQLADLGSLFAAECPLACQQLRPGSGLLAGLDPVRPREGPAVVSIWTTRDDVVVPADSARLEGALNVTVQSVCARSQVRHSGLPADHVVEAMVAGVLSAGPVPAWTPADCARLSS